MVTTRQQVDMTMDDSRWHSFRARVAWFDWDLLLGIAFGVLVALVAGWRPEVRQAGPSSLYAILGVAAGVAGIVLAVLSIFVALLNDDYMTVLSQAPGGTKRAWMPYVVTSLVSVVTALTSLLAVIVWPALPGWGQAASLGASAGLLAWSLAGTAQLVGITRFHGEMRFELFRGMQDARRLLRERKANDRSA